MHPASQRLILAATLLTSSIPALAQTPKDEESKIRAVVQSESDAWNQGDAEGFAAHYSETGDFTNVIGQQLFGRQAFIAQHARIFSTIYKGSHNVLTVSKVTFLRPDVALVDIDGILSGANRLPPGLKALDDGTLHVKLLEVMTKEKDGWTIAAFHNVAVTPLPPGGPPR
jgi:uncharacterized protein (TIGR02246 family)